MKLFECNPNDNDFRIYLLNCYEVEPTTYWGSYPVHDKNLNTDFKIELSRDYQTPSPILELIFLDPSFNYYFEFILENRNLSDEFLERQLNNGMHDESNKRKIRVELKKRANAAQ